MKILYLNYWSLNEPLTAAAIIPYLKIMQEDKRISEIHFVTFERGNENYKETIIDLTKVTHYPITPRYGNNFLLTKADEFIRIPRKLTNLAKTLNIDLIFAKASFAGAIAYMIHRNTKIPFIVESFEPHSDYMADCGEWKKGGFLYRYAKYYEKKQMKHAAKIITVTNNYKTYLIEKEHMDKDKVEVIPSCTEIDQFSFNQDDRNRIREDLGLQPSDIVGIYVGKFGGLYYDDESYDIFKSAYDHFDSKLNFIILTPEPSNSVIQKMTQRGIPRQSINVHLASHQEVPSFLSASDFAFSNIKPAFSKLFQCPIKNGEYWANGLSILMTYGIADDYKLMEQGLGGALFDLKKANINDAFVKIEHQLNTPNNRSTNHQLAIKYKSISIAHTVYSHIFTPYVS